MLTLDALHAEVADVVRTMLPPMTDPADVVPEARLDEEGLGFDSIALIDLLCECEDRFGVALPPDALFGPDDDEGPELAGAPADLPSVTVGDLIAEIARRLDILPA